MTAVRHPVSGASASRVGARERVLAAAYELFSRRGTRDVGIDTIVRRSGVAKMSLYHHFHSKQDLVAAFLERRERLWTVEWLKSEVYRRARSPGKRLLAALDLLSDWFRSEEFDGCPFIKVLLEYPGISQGAGRGRGDQESGALRQHVADHDEGRSGHRLRGESQCGTRGQGRGRFVPEVLSAGRRPLSAPTGRRSAAGP